MDRLTDRLGMTLVVEWVVKPQYKKNTNKQKSQESYQTGQMFRLIIFLVERTNHIVDFVMFQPSFVRRLLLYKRIGNGIT